MVTTDPWNVCAAALARELVIRGRAAAAAAARPNAPVIVANEALPAATKPSAVIPAAAPAYVIELF
jgi:hypothetical protein